MVFPSTEVAHSEHHQRARKPSASSLFLDHYSTRTENSYIPPYVKSRQHSEHPHPQSGAYDAYHDATVMTNSQHSKRSQNSSKSSDSYDDTGKCSPQSFKGGTTVLEVTVALEVVRHFPIINLLRLEPS